MHDPPAVAQAESSQNVLETTTDNNKQTTTFETQSNGSGASRKKVMSDVCLFVRRFFDICLYSLNMGHRNCVLLLTEETKSANFGTLKFELSAS